MLNDVRDSDGVRGKHVCCSLLSVVNVTMTESNVEIPEGRAVGVINIHGQSYSCRTRKHRQADAT